MFDQFPQVLRKRRESAGLTQVELAYKSDVSPGHISRIENGDFNVRLATVQRIASALNVPAAVLLGLSKDMSRRSA